MKKCIIFLIFLLLPVFLSAEVIFLKDGSKIKSKVTSYQDGIFLLQNNKKLLSSDLAVILLDEQYSYRVEKALKKLIIRSKKPIKNNEQVFIAGNTALLAKLTDYNKESIQMIFSGRNNKVSYRKNQIRAIFFGNRYRVLVREMINKKYFRYRGHHRYYGYHRGYKNLMFYLGLVKGSINLPFAESKNSTLWSDKSDWKVKGPKFGLTVYDFSVVYTDFPWLGGGFSIFQYQGLNRAYKSWIPIHIWIPLGVEPNKKPRDFYLSFEWGWLPYSDYPRYLNSSFSFMFNMVSIAFPVRLNLGALVDGDKNWEAYFSLDFSIGLYGG